MGIAALAVPPANELISWESLLAPYSQGTSLPDGFHIEAVHRGFRNDIVIAIDRRDDTATVEVHVAQRGRWPGVLDSQSFGIGYEDHHSSALQRGAIAEAIAETIRSHDHGLPSPDAIPLGPLFDATALPWWLEMLRGWRGALLGTSIVLLGLIWIIRSAWLAFAGLALGVIDLVGCAIGLPFGRHDFGAGWIAPGAAMLLWLVVRRQPSASREDRRFALAVTCVGLALRVALGPWGPLHVNGMGAFWITGAARDPFVIAAYGPGYRELFGPIAALAPSQPDWAIFACNALLSALAAALAFTLARLVGVERRVALMGAVLLAIDPVAIRMATTESYFPAIIFLCLTAGIALLLSLDQVALGDRSWAAAGIAGAGLLLVQAIRIHPAAWVPAAAVPFVVWAGKTGSFGNRILVFTGSIAIIGGLLLATSGDVLLDVAGNIRTGLLFRPLPLPLWRLTWATGAAGMYAMFARRKWLAVPGGICLAGMVMTRQGYGQSWIWQQCFDRLYLTVPLIAAIAAVPPSLPRRWWVTAPFALAIAFVWLYLGLPIVTARTTDHLEYRWLHEQLAQLPPDCRVIHVAGADKLGLTIPTYVRSRSAAAVEMNLSEPLTLEKAFAPAPCIYYVHTSLCSTNEGRAACEVTEGRLTLAPVARARFPPRPSSRYLSYNSDPVETVIERVERIHSN